MDFSKHIIWIQPRKAEQGERGALSRSPKIGLRREIRRRPLWLKYEQSVKTKLDKVQIKYSYSSVLREDFFNIWISFFQSRASRREQECLSLNLVLREESENFCLSVFCFQTRTGIEIKTILARIFENEICYLFLDWYFQKRLLMYQIFLT